MSEKVRDPPPGELPETELHKLIHYGCLFELEVHQMAEQRQLQDENKVLRKDIRRKKNNAQKKARRRLARRKWRDS